MGPHAGDVSLLSAGWRLLKQIGEDDLSGRAAELAYRFLLALFPFFIFLTALGGVVSDLAKIENPSDRAMDLLGAALPDDASSVLRGQLTEVTRSRSLGFLSFGIAGAVWAASSGIGSLIKALNRTYDVKETRPVWLRYGIAVGLTLLGGSFTLAALVLLLAGQIYGMRIAAELSVEGSAATLFTLARWPLVIAMLIVASAFLYWAAPNVKLPFKWITPGAVVFVGAWLLFSYLFGFYVGNFGSYNATYGALGGVVVLLVWLYLTAFVLLLGGEINAVLAKEVVPEKLPATPEQGATPERVPERKREPASRHAAADGDKDTQPPAPAKAAAGPLQIALIALIALVTLRRTAQAARQH